MASETELVAATASDDPAVGLRAVAALRMLREAVKELQVKAGARTRFEARAGEVPRARIEDQLRAEFEGADGE